MATGLSKRASERGLFVGYRLREEVDEELESGSAAQRGRRRAAVVVHMTKDTLTFTGGRKRALVGALGGNPPRYAARRGADWVVVLD